MKCSEQQRGSLTLFWVMYRKDKNPHMGQEQLLVFMFFEYKNVFCEREEIDTTKWLFIHPWNVPRE